MLYSVIIEERSAGGDWLGFPGDKKMLGCHDDHAGDVFDVLFC